MKRTFIDYFFAITGIILLASGLILVKTLSDPQSIMKALPYLLIGVGCGIFGQGAGSIISKRAIKSSPEIQKKMDIEKNDERNIAVTNRSKAKAYDMMVFVFGALLLAFALMSIDFIPILMLVCAYLFVIFYGVFYRIKYDKEM